MDPADSRDANERRLQSGVFVMGLIVFALLAIACHYQDAHLSTIHGSDPGDEERYCIRMETNDVEFSDVKDDIDNILWNTNNPANWDSLSRIFFYPAAIDCANVSDISDYDLEYIIHNENGGPAGEDAVTVGDLSSQWIHVDHTNFNKICIHLPANVFTLAKLSFDRPFGFTVVNHEMGHALGLADPNASATPAPENCVAENTITGELLWIELIMHSTLECGEVIEEILGEFVGSPGPGGFDVLAYPSLWDRTIVELIGAAVVEYD